MNAKLAEDLQPYMECYNNRRDIQRVFYFVLIERSFHRFTCSFSLGCRASLGVDHEALPRRAVETKNQQASLN